MNVKSLSDDDSYNEEGNISENGVEEGYLFFFCFLLAKWRVHNYAMLH